MIGREKRVVAIEQYLALKRVFDPVMTDCVRRSDNRTYFDKSWLRHAAAGETHHRQDRPVTGSTDLDDPRLSTGCRSSVRGIVYVGLDALTDAEVAAAVGNQCSPTVSVAGQVLQAR